MGRRTAEEALITGAQCQYARTKLGRTQAQLAKALEISRSQIANFETKGERFTPSEEVRKKLRAYFEEHAAGIDQEWPDADMTEGESDPPVSSRGMSYMHRLGAAAGCFRMSSELSEVQRDRLLSEIDKVRDRLEEIAASPAKPGVFEPFDSTTDQLIAEGDALVKKFGFLCIVAFGYGFISLPTAALVQGKKKPETIADALGLRYAEQFRLIGIKKNESQGEDEASRFTLMGGR